MTQGTRAAASGNKRGAGFVAAALLMGVPVGAAAWLPARRQAPDVEQERAYLAASVTDPVARLQADLDAGRVRLAWHPKHGYLPSLLKALKMPQASQTLVFSRTSFQRDRISRKAPRALYFSDDVYVGVVQGSDLLEISAVDPRWGAVFYTFRQAPPARPRFTRQTYDCLQCHNGGMTRGVPGHVMRSVYARFDGEPDLSLGSHLTTDESPWEQRWGGWYVSGTHGGMRHMGNEPVRGAENYATLDRDRGANARDLSAYFDAEAYLTPHSDIAALMVLTHQVNAHNLLAKAHYGTLAAVRDGRAINEGLGRPLDFVSDSTRGRVRSLCDPLLEALLFAREAPLTAPVRGTTDFAARFAAVGPRDSRGRSLRDLDLKTRLARYPCSYLVYSEAFRGLPAPARDYVLGRLAAILGGKDADPAFARLSAADRRAVHEILTETLPEYRAAASAGAAAGAASPAAPAPL